MEEPLAVRELRGELPPRAPDKLTAPLLPPVRTRAWALLIAAEKLMFAPAGVPPPFVVSTVTALPKAAGPVMDTAPPLVVTLPDKLIPPEPV